MYTKYNIKYIAHETDPKYVIFYVKRNKVKTVIVISKYKKPKVLNS